MKAAALEAPYRFHIDDRPRPALRPGWVLVEVKAAGICGSDMHFYKGDLPFAAGSVRGHEIAGVVVDAGDTKVPVGQAAVVCPMVGCGHCSACERGQYQVCESLQHIGGDVYSGGFAECAAVPAEKLYPFDPNTLPFAHAALGDCVGVGVHAVNVLRLQPGEITTIIGDGVIALFTLQAAVARGAGPIVLIGKHERNLEMARQMGAALAFDGTGKDLVSVVTGFSGKQDVVIEAAGGPNPPYEAAVKMVRKGGKVGLVGLTGSTNIPVPWAETVVEEKALIGMMGYSLFEGVDEMRLTVDLMESGQIRIPPEMITTIALDDIDHGFRMMMDRKNSGVIKVVISNE